MKGFIAKNALTALIEKVWQASGNTIDHLEVKFAGASAGIRYERKGKRLSAMIVLPAIDESAEVTQKFFNDLVAYVLHELGHAWFTDNEPWDEAKSLHGDIVGSIINGLEDAREELRVIRSGYADNARALFVQLTNNVFEGGFEVWDIRNVGAVCAVEGRRLNGYELIVPDLFLDNPFAEEIREALVDLQRCINTADVVKVAVELWEKIKPPPEGEPDPDKPDPDKPDPDGKPDPEGKPDGDKGDRGDKGDAPDGQPDTETEDKPEGDSKTGDKPSEVKTNGGSGSGAGSVKELDPCKLIEDQAREVSDKHVFKLPLRTKTIVRTFDWS